MSGDVVFASISTNPTGYSDWINHPLLALVPGHRVA
jgi:hypothetical protein